MGLPATSPVSTPVSAAARYAPAAPRTEESKVITPSPCTSTAARMAPTTAPRKRPTTSRFNIRTLESTQPPRRRKRRGLALTVAVRRPCPCVDRRLAFDDRARFASPLSPRESFLDEVSRLALGHLRPAAAEPRSRAESWMRAASAAPRAAALRARAAALADPPRGRRGACRALPPCRRGSSRASRSGS